MIEAKYFTVRYQTEDFIGIALDREVEFKGHKLELNSLAQILEFTQYLLDEHRIMLVCPRNTGGILICRKVKESA